jgi:hypothetical protein
MISPEPEFKVGDYVTYRHGGFLMRSVVIDIRIEDGNPRYLLMEEPEGKPIAKHNQVDAHPAYILESKCCVKPKPTTFHYDKKKNNLTRAR